MSSRYELKYVIEPSDLFKLESILLSHSASFTRVFPNRIIHNIYFDTIDYKSAQSNLGGISDRVKIRYRWYGNNAAPKLGTIEQKIKHNSLGQKKYIKDVAYSSMSQLVTFINNAFPSYHLKPSIYNQYVRQYFEDFTNSFRLTIDSAIKYKYPESGFETDGFVYEDPKIIVELKFDEKDYKRAENITQYFPFRQNKHSKYVTGVQYTIY